MHFSETNSYAHINDSKTYKKHFYKLLQQSDEIYDIKHVRCTSVAIINKDILLSTTAQCTKNNTKQFKLKTQQTHKGLYYYHNHSCYLLTVVKFPEILATTL